MDSDLLSDRPPALAGSLLPNLSYQSLTDHCDVTDHWEPGRNESITHPRVSHVNEAGAVISRIEDIFEAISDCILDEKKELTIQLKTRKKTGKQEHASNSRESTRASEADVSTIRYPSKKPQEAWKFAAILRILELSHEALATGIVTTKRDIYYRDPELFMKQSVVDRYVDDIAYTLGVKREALNIVAAAKGLISGAFTITRDNETVVDYGSELERVLIPNIKEIRSINILDVRWILVIEKEATFRTLSTTQYYTTSLSGKGIILTAKGYPDIQTRQFLYLLSTLSPPIPIYCLVDYDPDGIGIMSTYKHGSMNLAHETADLAVPSIQWMGVRSADIVRCGADKVGLLALKERDRRIAGKMLHRDGLEAEWRRELQVMLMLGVKAEIQILSEGVGGLEEWLDRMLLGGR